MPLEDYFDFHADDDIRLRGHRIGIESILYDYIYRSRTPEEIAETFDTISLEQVYATILYYLQNKKTVERYMFDWMEFCQKARDHDRQNNSAFYEKMRKLKQERQTDKVSS